jgi:diketogulonate reductase-like aldo/keto reductase
MYVIYKNFSLKRSNLDFTLLSDIMKYKNFGKTKEKISIIGIGTWKMGVNAKEEVATIKHAISLGINFIDTAEMYGTEWIVKEAIKNVDRKKLFIATKISPNNFHYKDVIKACEASLNRLGTKYIDLYQLHWPNYSIPIKETMQAMEYLLDEGKIKHIGVSNFSVNEMNEAQTALEHSNIESNQVEYSVLVRYIEKAGILNYCKRKTIEVIAYSPIIRGILFQNKYKEVYKNLVLIGKKHNATAVDVALNWIIRKGAIPIPKASSISHIEDDAKAANFMLSKSEMKLLDEFIIDYKKGQLGENFRWLLKRNSTWAKIMTNNANKKIKNL